MEDRLSALENHQRLSDSKLEKFMQSITTHARRTEEHILGYGAERRVVQRLIEGVAEEIEMLKFSV